MSLRKGTTIIAGNTNSSTVNWGNITGDINNQTDLKNSFDNKQETLVSGENIKTVNGQSLLGSGNINISSGSTWGAITGNIDSQTDLKNKIDGVKDYADELDTTKSFRYHNALSGGNFNAYINKYSSFIQNLAPGASYTFEYEIGDDYFNPYMFEPISISADYYSTTGQSYGWTYYPSRNSDDIQITSVYRTINSNFETVFCVTVKNNRQEAITGALSVNVFALVNGSQYIPG